MRRIKHLFNAVLYMAFFIPSMIFLQLLLPNIGNWPITLKQHLIVHGNPCCGLHLAMPIGGLLLALQGIKCSRSNNGERVSVTLFHHGVKNPTSKKLYFYTPVGRFKDMKAVNCETHVWIMLGADLDGIGPSRIFNVGSFLFHTDLWPMIGAIQEDLMLTTLLMTLNTNSTMLNDQLNSIVHLRAL